MFELFKEINIAWIVITVFVIAILLLLSGFAQASNAYQYQKQQALFTKAEINLLKVLEQVVINPNLAIYGKIRVADILKPVINKNVNRKKWWAAFSKISQKHVDYVIVDKHDYSVVCVIELNDRSHNRKATQKRDKFMRKAYASANIELVEIKAARHYFVNDLLEQFSESTQHRLQGDR
ncbi:MAG: putative queD like [Candidatus Ruthia sp. Asou_11_S2]|nr:putative queD like [Candidatus Ruthia sp. Asou_11_S2]